MSEQKPALPTPAARHKARHYALQALYQWSMTGADASEIIAQFRVDHDLDQASVSKVDVGYFQELVHECIAHAVALDELYAPLLDRRVDELDPVERALLRLASYEMQHRIDVPCRVVINEAVALAKKFGATDGHKFVNGVLDKLARQVRQLEMRADRN